MESRYLLDRRQHRQGANQVLRDAAERPCLSSMSLVAMAHAQGLGILAIASTVSREELTCTNNVATSASSTAKGILGNTLQVRVKGLSTHSSEVARKTCEGMPLTVNKLLRAMQTHLQTLRPQHTPSQGPSRRCLAQIQGQIVACHRMFLAPEHQPPAYP